MIFLNPDILFSSYKKKVPDFDMTIERYYEEEFVTYLEQKIAGDLGEDPAREKYLDLDARDTLPVSDVLQWGVYDVLQD